jgi:hypothetical protein
MILRTGMKVRRKGSDGPVRTVVNFDVIRGEEILTLDQPFGKCPDPICDKEHHVVFADGCEEVVE